MGTIQPPSAMGDDDSIEHGRCRVTSHDDHHYNLLAKSEMSVPQFPT
jgi:hypothetical protein